MQSLHLRIGVKVVRDSFAKERLIEILDFIEKYDVDNSMKPITGSSFQDEFLFQFRHRNGF
jgi:hypothetical protein